MRIHPAAEPAIGQLGTHGFSSTSEETRTRILTCRRTGLRASAMGATRFPSRAPHGAREVELNLMGPPSGSHPTTRSVTSPAPSGAPRTSVVVSITASAATSPTVWSMTWAQAIESLDSSKYYPRPRGPAPAGTHLPIGRDRARPNRWQSRWTPGVVHAWSRRSTRDSSVDGLQADPEAWPPFGPLGPTNGHQQRSLPGVLTSAFVGSGRRWEVLTGISTISELPSLQVSATRESTAQRSDRNRLLADHLVCHGGAPIRTVNLAVNRASNARSY